MLETKIKCRVCGIYYVPFSEGHANRRLCGKVCRLIHSKKQDEKNRRKNERRRERDKREITCKYCNIVFVADPFNVIEGCKIPRLYCSKSCKRKASYYRRKEMLAKEKFMEKAIEQRRIENEKFTQRMFQRYESTKEQINKLLNSRIVKRWKSYSQYTKSEAFEKLKKAAFLRDKNRCKFCGFKPDTIHHFFYCKWGTENLDAVISVCNHCHFEYCHTDIKYNKELDAIMARE